MRFKCWLDGHDYIFGVGTRFMEDELVQITVCTVCGARAFTPVQHKDGTPWLISDILPLTTREKGTPFSPANETSDPKQN